MHRKSLRFRRHQHFKFKFPSYNNDINDFFIFYDIDFKRLFKNNA